MGQARARGTFEERKAQAILEGRDKSQTLWRWHWSNEVDNNGVPHRRRVITEAGRFSSFKTLANGGTL